MAEGRGQGYNQEKAIMGQEPNLQMHVWSAWFPEAHRAMTDMPNLPGQVPSEIEDLVTWQLRQALSIQPQEPVWSQGTRSLKKASVLTQVHGQQLTPSLVAGQKDVAQVPQPQGGSETWNKPNSNLQKCVYLPWNISSLDTKS